MIKPIFTFTFRVSFLSLVYITCFCMCTCEMSQFFQGYQNRSCRCVILTTPTEQKKTMPDLSCLPDCNCSKFPITSPESETPQWMCPLPACLFNIMRICVHMCLLYVCQLVCHCLCVYFVTWGRVCQSWEPWLMRKQVLLSGDNRMPLLTSSQHSQTWICEGTWGRFMVHFTSGLVLASLTFPNKRKEHPQVWYDFQKKTGQRHVSWVKRCCFQQGVR